MRDFRNEIRHEDIGSAYESSAVGEEALRLGVEAVGILVTLEVPSQTLWVPKSIKSYEKRVGRSHWDTRTQTEHVMHYFNSGQAWQIAEEVQQRGDSTLIVSRTAIDDQGRVFKRWAEKGAKNIVSHRRVDRDQPVEGFVSPKYLSPPRAIEEINSDEFQTGIFSLIGGYGVYRTAAADIPTARHDSPAITEVMITDNPLSEMSDFERIIQQRVGELRGEDRQRAAEEEAARRMREEKEARIAIEVAKARKLGSEVVQMLMKSGIETQPIWKLTAEDYRGRPTNNESDNFVQIGEGWHIVSGNMYIEGGIVGRFNTGINTDGDTFTFSAFSNESFPNATSPSYRPTTVINGLIQPEFARPESATSQFDFPSFQKGVASLIAGHGPYEAR